MAMTQGVSEQWNNMTYEDRWNEDDKYLPRRPVRYRSIVIQQLLAKRVTLQYFIGFSPEAEYMVELN